MLVLSGLPEAFAGRRAEVLVVVGIGLAFADARESNTGRGICPV